MERILSPAHHPGWDIARLGAIGLTALALILAPSTVRAETSAVEMAPAGFIRLAGANGGCTAPRQPLSPALAAPAKSLAILGGATSALDAIRLQQSAAVSQPASAQVAALASAPALTPGADAARPVPGSCQSLAAVRPAPAAGLGTGGLALPADPEHFLASKRVRIGRTNFDSDWNRVRAESLPRGLARRHLGAVSGDRHQALATVNRWVNRSIAYVEDQDLFGKADYWAGARKTLKLRKGDCEDMALLKMQMLAAAGIPREDMILTVARDLVRMADHAVLIVRTEQGYRMLDNASDEVIDAGPQNDYRAILSFGVRETWLHGA
ncbi:hypothetical protein GRI40_01975 [Altererythrobacter aerius]|uniref:Transglutaminase n=1 Tax=Tsuneonella aeria TaxID=1837929 RepID=A0A6I4T8V4_9SPHN|nr:transglutaminase-like cysteine peptidase [Tsuneonella aeria]MXO73989.1 hypothetical protein [Tsuneonella aeria]